MSIPSHRARKLIPLVLGVVALGDAVLLLIQDAFPRSLAAAGHEFLAAFSLAMIAFAYLVFRIVQRAALADLAKAIVLAAAFLFWAANQFWSTLPQAGLFNDIAIGLFVLDVFLAISGWPQASVERSFEERSQDSERGGLFG